MAHKLYGTGDIFQLSRVRGLLRKAIVNRNQRDAGVKKPLFEKLGDVLLVPVPPATSMDVDDRGGKASPVP